MIRRYRIRRTIVGWMVQTANGGYAFANSHAAAIEQVARFEVVRLGGWEWSPYTTGGRFVLVNSHTGAKHRFRNHQQAAVFLHALQQARKARTQ